MWCTRCPTPSSIRYTLQGLPSLVMDVGPQDGRADQSRGFHAELKGLGVSPDYAEWPGGHDWTYWHAHVGEGLRWLAERIRP